MAFDSFARDNLPPPEQWPDLLDAGLSLSRAAQCVTELLDRRVDAGGGARRCLLSPAAHWSYAETRRRVDRIAEVLTARLGLIPGNACCCARRTRR